jgi:hypothetical protein
MSKKKLESKNEDCHQPLGPRTPEINTEDWYEPIGLRTPEIDTAEPMGFTGIARTLQCYDNQGFRNFKILTLHILDGLVINIEYSDPYANFEAISRMELANEIAIHHLNNNWAPGKTLSK